MDKNIFLEKPYFTAAYNHDPACLEEYAKAGISEIWAGIYMPEKSLFGSGRFQKTSIDKEINLDDLGNDFLKANELGLKTTFLLNPACSGNAEFTEEGIAELKKVAAFINKYKVDYITLGQPFIVKVFKKLCPEVKIKFSSHYNANSLGKFKFLLDDLDVDVAVVSQFANKNFKLLKEITKRWDPSRFEIMCTVPCIMGCPMRNWHAQFYAHSVKTPDKDFIPPYIPCLAEPHHNKNIAVSASFVRRDDIKYYQKLGINIFKIGERRDLSENNINCAKYFTCNLEDYNPFFRKSKALSKMNLKALDGFYEKFFNEECDGTKYNCQDCEVCEEYGKKVFSYTEEDVKKLGIPPTKQYFDDILLKKWLEQF